MPAEDATFSIRDGYHLRALNEQHAANVDKACFPELLRSTPRAAVSVKAPDVRVGEATTLDATSPLEAWLVFRHRDLVARSNQEVTPASPSPPRHYALPRQPCRPVKLQPKTQLRYLPHLLLSPRTSRTPPLVPTAPEVEPKRYETETSRFRMRTTIKASRTSTLSARIVQLMLAPEALADVEAAARKHRACDRVTTNKQLVVTPVPPEARVERSETLQLRRKAQVARYFQHQETMRQATERSVDRWGARRRQEKANHLRHARAKRVLVSVLVALAASKLRERFKAIEPSIKMAQMVHACRKIQAFWRAKTHAMSMSHAAEAVVRIQRFILSRIGTYRNHCKRRAVVVLITSLRECHDAKFRRAMFKYRQSVRQFQAMWRSWAVITDARIKLLLLLWNKVEKKLHAASESREKSPGPGHVDHHRRSNLSGRHSACGPPSSAGTKKVVHAVKLLGHLSVLNVVMSPEDEAQKATQHAARVPLALKVSLLKALLSTKRHEFLNRREQLRAAWEKDRDERRRRGFGMDVSSVLVFDSLRYGKAQFLLLQHVRDADIAELIAQAESIHAQSRSSMPSRLDARLF
ncbi:hypothetical protein SPRG_22216 [Saprolegnia parasitica CBS 223.65]|uniref:Uncharacterized protein n=1 Tax=Saprolegnia parasitica (strain CBS 223.65) TaxID=695850 RepID=A0A067CCC5_SAPPC|nr:hypothetical protein SPRG_22216 [Saprolegnia parasitica CBS 223.65]KDO26825.1 hypothetical protein SPRG_22216 [Saprolegnia parasitica CBS 223.65]|eukprot:XP_012202536.1 hypothetical protein SPRG_22216 [Saprolegnia parasitica CBS 223.65]